MTTFNLSKTSVCSVERGLYLLRYGPCAPGEAPIVSVEVQAGDIDLIPAPGRSPEALSAPGQSIAVLARTPGTLTIALQARSTAPMPETSVNLDLIDRGSDRDPSPVAAPVAPARAVAPSPRAPAPRHRLSITAHVARIGDVVAEDGAWIAGPDMPLPIEGLAIVAQDLDVAIAYQAMSAGTQWRWTDIAQGGQFAGSRQKADPLRGLRLEVVGPGANDWEIAATAMFLGHPSSEKTGRSITFESGDPLVGLKIALSKIKQFGPLMSDETKGSIRVFRARR